MKEENKNQGHKRKMNSKDQSPFHSKQKKQQRNGKKKKQKGIKRKQLWLDRCISNGPPKGGDSCDILKVFVTGVELYDYFMQDTTKECEGSSKVEETSHSKEVERSIVPDTLVDKNNSTKEIVAKQDSLETNATNTKHETIQTCTDDKQDSVKTCTDDRNDSAVEACAVDTKQGSIEECGNVEKSSDSKSKSTQPFVQIIRHKSSQKKKSGNFYRNYVELPNGDCGDGIVNPFPKDEVDDKYWAQRKRFFSKFDDGIQLDKESWYSITPEAIADHIAKRMIEEVHESKKMKNDQSGGAVILDAFCGCGGNAIGFAKVQSPDVKLIVCVDNDRSKLRRAANNASIYGIHSDKIVFIECDSTFILQHCYKDGELIEYDNAKTQWGDVETETIKGFQIGGISLLPKRLDAIFLSPPWGGPNYMAVGKKGYLLESISVDSTDGKIRGDELLVMAKNACKEKIVLYFVPKSINGHAVGKSAWKANYKNVEIEKNILNGKLKTVTIYLKN